MEKALKDIAGGISEEDYLLVLLNNLISRCLTEGSEWDLKEANYESRIQENHVSRLNLSLSPFFPLIAAFLNRFLQRLRLLFLDKFR